MKAPILIDITLTMKPDQPAWPGDPPFSCTPASSIKNGGNCNTSLLHFSSHFGTHLDAPYHFEEDGIKVDELSLYSLIGPVLVHEIDTPQEIKPDHLPDLREVKRILFKTRNSDFIHDGIFHEDYVSVGLEAAKALTDAGVVLVGIDYFSVEAFKNPGNPVHHQLCDNGVILVEGVDLRHVSQGWYEITVLPLKIANGDGSPCRAVLRTLS